METFDFTSEWAEFQRKYPKGANLPLEDYAGYLSDFYNLMKRHAFYNSDCRESMVSVIEKMRGFGESICLAILKSFPVNDVNEKTIKTLFSMVLLNHNELLFRVRNLEDLKERVEDVENGHEALDNKLESLNSAIMVVEEKVKRLEGK